MRQHPPILQAAPGKVCRLPVVSQSDRGRFLPLPDHCDTSLISWHCHSMTVARRMPARASRLVARPVYCTKKAENLFQIFCFSLLREMGLEPTRAYTHKIRSLVLPVCQFQHSRLAVVFSYLSTTSESIAKIFQFVNTFFKKIFLIF